MEGSTTLTQRLGDAAAQELLRTHNTIIRDALKAHGGSEIKHTGDGVMASFPSAIQRPRMRHRHPAGLPGAERVSSRSP